MQNDDTPGPEPVDPTIPRNVGGRDIPHIPATEFDPIAVGDEIAGHIAEADKAIAANREHSLAAGALLLDVQHISVATFVPTLIRAADPEPTLQNLPKIGGAA